jgi:NAD(P)H-dependent FMN reductase
MITVVSGTNRPNSNSLKLARLASDAVRAAGQAVELLDLAELPIELFSGSAYAEKPAGFAPFQRTIVETHGVLSVIPEYNGACPGVMKYFIDMLRFPESLYEKPAGFIGLSSGPWGAVRAVEQLEMVFQYRHAVASFPTSGRSSTVTGRSSTPRWPSGLMKWWGRSSSSASACADS